MIGELKAKWLVLAIGLVIGFQSLALGQNASLRKHLIYFKDKTNSPYSVSNPQQYLSERALERRQKQNISLTKRDLPVNPVYVTGLKSTGAQVLYTSKWFNAAVVYCDSAKLAEITKLPFVKNGQTVSRKITESRNVTSVPKTTIAKPIVPRMALRKNLDKEAYGKAYNQANMLGAVDMHQAGFRGEGMHVAVFDGGFPGVDQLAAFSHLFEEGRLKASYDFVGHDSYVFERDNHGTNVLATMAAYQPGNFIGTAFNANYYLFITEDSQSEHHIEEVNWLLAAEFADSAGVDVINASLGYNDFDAPSVDYTYQDLDGNRALVTRAADFAAATGMLIINSAGNEGNKPWRYISAPADGDSVLAVGAVDSLGYRASFSSTGPTADGRIKPNVSAQGLFAATLTKAGTVVRANGTSFSSPILSGMAVGFWQANPHLSNMEVIRYLQLSGSNAQQPDNLTGYGVPTFFKANELVKQQDKKILLYPNPPQGNILHLRVGKEYQNQLINVTVFNTVAQKLLSKSFWMNTNTYDINMDISSLLTGIYVCNIKVNDNTTSIKFLKQH